MIRHSFSPRGWVVSYKCMVVLLLLAITGVSFLVIVPDVHSGISQVWANNGEDKVTRDELRASTGTDVTNALWDGSQVSLFGAKNEVISFNLVLEAAATEASNVTVSFSTLTGPGGAIITSSPAFGNGVFSWIGRNIELFYIRYLEIKGLSQLCYSATYDERHVPERFRRPWTGEGDATGKWIDRPDHNKLYPDIAVPLELVPQFTIDPGSSQNIWVDIYIPKTATAGIYQGTISIGENGATTHSIPVSLTVLNFTLPDYPSAPTMLCYSHENINYRYLGLGYPDTDTSDYRKSLKIIDNHFHVAHRHKISLIDGDTEIDRMDEAWTARLSGRLFSASNGYDGPGIGVGNNVYSIGTYGSWSSQSWQKNSKTDFWTHSDAWVNWFTGKSFLTPTDYFLYLIDESDDYPTTQKWANWLETNPGPGSSLMSLATISDPMAWQNSTPDLDIPACTIDMGITALWESAANALVSDPDKRFYYYNGARPASGTFCTEDDGVALRVNGWIQHKKKIDRWFYWESTYYNNYQAGQGETDVFTRAQTYGYREPGKDPDFARGEYGWNYTNGDGVLFYPGTDRHYTGQSYGVDGPFASLRLKHWRRGIQDADYLALAEAVDPAATRAIVDRMIPKVLWEYGVETPADPTYVYTDISWPTDPDDWEKARAELAAIILNTADGYDQTVYIPHITGGFSDWSDHLQADNTSAVNAGFNLTLYNEAGAVVYSGEHTAQAYGTTEIKIKDLAGPETVMCGEITYSETGLNFRLSQESLIGGGVAEFRLTDGLASSLGFYFSSFKPSLQLKGVAITNFSHTAATVTLTAIGKGAILGSTQVVIGPHQKIIGSATVWFDQVSLDDIAFIQASSVSPTLSGIAISGNMSNSLLVFMPGIISR